MANILLGVTGSVAAIKAPELVRSLQTAGHEVRVVATQPALYFFNPAELPSGTLFTDEDEWPRREKGQTWQRTDPVLHIELRRWAELLLVAPLDANTLAKFAYGLSDNCLTCIFRAWDPQRPILLAPAMNTLMWEHSHTQVHLRLLAELIGLKPPDGIPTEELLARINDNSGQRLGIVGPIDKMLACGDIGMGGMAEVATLVQAVQSRIKTAKKS